MGHSVEVASGYAGHAGPEDGVNYRKVVRIEGGANPYTSYVAISIEECPDGQIGTELVFHNGHGVVDFHFGASSDHDKSFGCIHALDEILGAVGELRRHINERSEKLAAEARQREGVGGGERP